MTKIVVQYLRPCSIRKVSIKLALLCLPLASSLSAYSAQRMTKWVPGVAANEMAICKGLLRPSEHPRYPKEFSVPDGISMLFALKDKTLKINPEFWNAPLESGIFSAPKKSLKALGISEANPDWRMLQFPTEIPLDEYAELYVRNVTDGIKKFADGISSGETEKLAGFKQVLSDQHKTTILGSTPENPYGGFYNGSYWKTEWAQMVRVAENTGEPMAISEEDFVRSLIEELQSEAGTLRKDPRTIELFPESWLRDINPGAPASELYDPRVETIKGLPEAAYPANKVEWGEVLHDYPDPEFIALYEAEMHQLLLKIVHCAQCSRLDILELVSDYYHTAINIHYFPRVNQSIFMSQVNYLNYLMGIKGIRQIDVPPLSFKLDSAALMLGREKFRSLFIYSVLHGNAAGIGP